MSGRLGTRSRAAGAPLADHVYTRALRAATLRFRYPRSGPPARTSDARPSGGEQRDDGGPTPNESGGGKTKM